MEKPIAVTYKEVRLECGLRLDLLVEGTLVVELKTVDKLLSVHEAQLLTYMKMARVGVGFDQLQ